MEMLPWNRKLKKVAFDFKLKVGKEKWTPLPITPPPLKQDGADRANYHRGIAHDSQPSGFRGRVRGRGRGQNRFQYNVSKSPRGGYAGKQSHSQFYNYVDVNQYYHYSQYDALKPYVLGQM